MNNFLTSSDITILVTDSGIGGISVANQLYNFFQTNRYYKNVNIVYADSRYKKIGYNSMQNDDEKIKTFSKRMFYLYNRIKPDIIFLACNTLSVLLNKTEFYKKCSVPIIDILNAGLCEMFNPLNNKQLLFILGTKTTIKNNFYKNCLINFGYDSNLIINQLCPNLAKYIQQSTANNYMIRENIKWLVNRIIQKKNNDNLKKFTVSFNCTHYYFVIPYFKKYFAKLGYDKINFICPNYNMIKCFCQQIKYDRFNDSKITVKLFNFKLSQIQKHKIKHFLRFNDFSNKIFQR